MNFSPADSWSILSPIEQSIREKIIAAGKPLKEWDVRINYGIKTGLNDAFIIDSATRDALIAADPKSTEIIRPILRGRDIKRYEFNFANLWIICTETSTENSPGIVIDDYPAIKDHLDRFYPALEKRFDKGCTPYHLRRCAYMDDFSKQKIVWGEISDKPKFALDEKGQYVTDVSTFFMVGESLLYLFGVLNSKVSQYYFSQFGTTTGVGTVRWKKFKIEQLPIPRISELDKKKFTALVGEIVKGSEQGDDVSELVSRVDDLVYNLIGLSKDEITVIEQYCSR